MKRLDVAARLFVFIVAFTTALFCFWRLEAGYDGVTVDDGFISETPVTIIKPNAPSGDRLTKRPVVVIAHGFAGSRSLMEPFGVTLAKSGFIAVTFDFFGHGDNALPLSGDVTKESGATATLVEQLSTVVDFARGLDSADGRVGLLGHSMASDVVVRLANQRSDVEATVGVSLFSEDVTANAPKNLLIIVGEYEDFLSQEALKAVELTIDGSATEGQTYGVFSDGDARRAVFADGVEHVGVLYSRESLTEARDWFRAAFNFGNAGEADVRGPWIIGLLLSVFALAWPLAALLPQVTVEDSRKNAASRIEGYGRAVVPAVATPLLLWPLPTDYLPVLVADYLAVHFALYGALTLLILCWRGGLSLRVPSYRLLGAIMLVAAFGVFAIGLPIDTYVTSFIPHDGRWSLIALLLIGTFLYTVSDAWAVWDQPFDVRIITKLMFLGSLALAISLNIEKLFFLIIIFPVVVLFFLLYGTIGRWVSNATGHPTVSGVANGVAFAWALGVTFPLFSG
ncbi:MAG: alpha/beta hydrolase [Pseudomonadota bacterium]